MVSDKCHIDEKTTTRLDGLATTTKRPTTNINFISAQWAENKAFRKLLKKLR